MKEKEILKKLEILSISSSEQLEKNKLDFWWQKKYKEIKDSQLKEETIKEKLMEINEIYEDLSKVDEKLLFEIINKKSKEENIVDSDIDLYNQGVDHYNQDEYEKSIKKLSEAIHLKSDNPDYFNLRGWSYHFLKNYKKAIEDATKAIDLESDESDHFRLRGWSYYNLEEYEQAREDVTKAIDLNSDDPDNFNLSGWIYNDLEEYEQAIEDANKAIDLNPDEPQHFRLRGWAYCHLGKCELAIEDATKLINLEIDNPEHYELRAYARKILDFRESGDLSTEFTKDRNIADNLEEIKNYLNEADRYYEDNRIIEAIDYYEKFLSKSNAEIKDIFGKDAMIRINNRILEYRRMINS